MIHELFIDEIVMIYKKMDGNTVSDEYICEIKSQLMSKQFHNLPNTLPKTPISISYDMCWSRRGCGKLYNSLSGHAFVIECRT